MTVEQFTRAGVLGWPIGHSRSPRLHGHWLARHRVPGTYLPLPVHPDRLGDAVAGLVALGFAGANVTVPHKETVRAFVHRETDRARRIGAVNTLVIDGEGRISGDNTDGIGFMANLGDGVSSWTADRGPALVLGAGGAARAVVVSLIEGGCPSLVLVNRNRARAETLAAEVDAVLAGAPITVGEWDDRDRLLADTALLVNTTSLGMVGQPPLQIDLSLLPRDATVTDLVYQPLETPLLAQARTRGCAVVDGLGMLLHQAAPGFEAWFGVRPVVDADLRAAVLPDTSGQP